jgi:hypothetical protein
MVTSVNNVLQLGDVPVATGFYFNDSFTGAAVTQSKWISKAGTNSAEAALTAGTGAKPTGGIAGLTTALDTPGNGALRLTNADNNQAAFVLFDEAFVSNRGVNVTFDFFAYGGTGADGISFFLIDGSTPGANVTPGDYGGSLGYASGSDNGGTSVTTNGLTNAYLGVGIDEFGNFSDPAGVGPGTGGPGQVADSIAVRGKGNGATGYNYLTGSGSLTGGLDVTSATTRAGALRTIEIDLSSAGILNVSVDLNGDRDFDDAGEQAISNFNVQTPNGAAPTTYKFGFSGGTGGLTNIHELRNLALAPSKTSNAGALTTPNAVSFGDFGTGLTYVENAAPGTIQPGLTIAGAPTVTSATVKIDTTNFNATQDRLTIGGVPLTASGSIAGTPLTWTYDAPTGTFTLTTPTGTTATAAQYQAALRQVAYANTSDAPTTGDRTIRYTLLNGANTVTLRDALVKINAVDDLPTVGLTSTNVPINQPGAVVASLTINDPDGTADAPSYSAFGVTGGNNQFEIVPGATAGTYQLKLKTGVSIAAGATIPAISVGFTDAGAPNGGAVNQNFNLTPGQRRAEIFWRNPDGTEAVWQLDNADPTKLVGAVLVNSPYNTPTWKLKGIADMDGDGIKDHIYQNGTQIVYLPFTEAGGQTSGVKLGVTPKFNNAALFGASNGQTATPGAGWDLVAVENVAGTPQADLIFYSRSLGILVYWETDATGGITNGGAFTSSAAPSGQGTGPNAWKVAAVADFTGDNKVDILWQQDNGGFTVLWKLNGTVVDLVGSKALPAMAASFAVAGTGDFNGDGIKDVVWRDNAANITRFWSFNTSGTPVQTADNGALVGGSNFQIQGIADINGDGKSDILWRDQGSGRTVLWNLNLGTNPGPTFGISSIVLAGSGFINNYLPTVTVNTPFVSDRSWVITAASGPV